MRQHEETRSAAGDAESPGDRLDRLVPPDALIAQVREELLAARTAVSCALLSDVIPVHDSPLYVGSSWLFRDTN